MLQDDPNLKSHYRMPRVFGALPGPRNVPKDKQHLPNNETILHVTVAALTDGSALAALCPPGCIPEGDPILTVGFTYKSNIGWLGGHDYAIAHCGFRVAYDSPSHGRLMGQFQPVLWENLADPILSGRDELGYAKLFAELPAARLLGSTYQCQAFWQGFRFLDLEVHDLEDVAPEPQPASGSFHHKFVPATGRQNEADVDHLTYSPPGTPPAGYFTQKIVRKQAGVGSFRFIPCRWEDIPFQYPVINALAALPLLEMRGATVVHQQGTGTIGDISADGLRPID